MAGQGNRKDYEEAIKDDSNLSDYMKRKREKERELAKRKSRETKKNKYVD